MSVPPVRLEGCAKAGLGGRETVDGRPWSSFCRLSDPHGVQPLRFRPLPPPSWGLLSPLLLSMLDRFWFSRMKWEYDSALRRRRSSCWPRAFRSRAFSSNMFCGSWSSFGAVGKSISSRLVAATSASAFSAKASASRWAARTLSEIRFSSRFSSVSTYGSGNVMMANPTRVTAVEKKQQQVVQDRWACKICDRRIQMTFIPIPFDSNCDASLLLLTR